MSEFGRRCQSCYKIGGDGFARMYHRMVYGWSGKNKYIKLWRRLCPECWKRAEKKLI